MLLSVLFSGCATKEIVRPPAGATIVAQDGSGDYCSITEAVKHAQTGATIYIKPGTYHEAVELEAVAVNLLGSGPDRTIIDADSQYAAITLASDGNRISGLTLTGASWHGIYVKDGHQIIENCLIFGNNDRGIYISNQFGNGTAEINHCTIVANEVSGIYVIQDTSATAITNCIIFGNNDRGIYISNQFGNGTAEINHCTIVANEVSGIYAIQDTSATAITNCIIAFNNRGIVSDETKGKMRIECNCFYNQIQNFERGGEGHGNIEQDPKFLDPKRHDFRLANNSPCLKAASDNKNMGCF